MNQNSELEQQLDHIDHTRPNEQLRCHHYDRIFLAAAVVLLSVCGCAISEALAWFLATD
jgi:hypothetical protein